MADKKIASASREKEEQILKLQRKVEESQVQLTKKEKWVNNMAMFPKLFFLSVELSHFLVPGNNEHFSKSCQFFHLSIVYF